MKTRKNKLPSLSEANGLSRRDLFKTSALAACSLPFCKGTAAAQTQPAPSPPPLPKAPLNRFPRMVQEYYVEGLRRFEEVNRGTKASLKTKADAEAYVKAVRKKILDCFGPFPEKTPLHPRLTGVVEREAYKIEKVIFESRPGFPVTGNLYIPKGRAFPLPGVLGLCGHSDNGKAAEPYQSFSQGLAKLGYMVLIIDPVGQGERLQYPDAAGKSRVGVGVREHLCAGNQQLLVGEWLWAWRAWDGIRALDYLLTRSEVDPRRVGVTGNSGGGTMTTWLCGLEPRFAMAAPGCFVTTFRRNLENELPADIEQCPPRVLAQGLDHEDFIAAMAPKPVILLAKEKDYFDARGTEEAYARLKRLYRLLGAGENIALSIGPSPHGYSKESREAMIRWFNRSTGASNAQNEPDLVIEKDETLQCTASGQVSELSPRNVAAFTREHSQALSNRRTAAQGSALIRSVSDLLKLPKRAVAPDYRILRPLRPRQYPAAHATVYAVETEQGIHAIVYRLASEQHLSRPPVGNPRAVLYVAHRSSDAELREEPLIRQMLAEEPAAAFYACDVRGIGESQPDTCGENSFLDAYGSDYFYAAHALMLDRPVVGQKTHDLLSVLDWLATYGHREVHLAAKGWGALPAAFAALLDDRVVQVTLKNGLTSYTDVAESETYAWPLSALLPGVLGRFDLPDCYRALEKKKLRQIEPWGANTFGM